MNNNWNNPLLLFEQIARDKDNIGKKTAWIHPQDGVASYVSPADPVCF